MAHQVHRLLGRQRVEPHEHGVAAARAPGRPLVEQITSRQREHQRATRPAPALRAQPLDEVEHRGFEQVGVFEDQEHRMIPRKAVDERDEPCLDVVNEG